MRWAVHVAYMGKNRGVYRVFVGKPDGRRPLGRHRRRWEDNIKMDLQEVKWEDTDCIDLARDRERVGGHLWMRQWTFGFHKTLGIWDSGPWSKYVHTKTQWEEGEGRIVLGHNTGGKLVILWPRCSCLLEFGFQMDSCIYIVELHLSGRWLSGSVWPCE